MMALGMDDPNRLWDIRGMAKKAWQALMEPPKRLDPEQYDEATYNAFLMDNVLRRHGVEKECIQDAHKIISLELHGWSARISKESLTNALRRVQIQAEAIAEVFDELLNDPPNAPYGCILAH